MEEQQIKYEPHPVSPDRKAELRAQGYRILDLCFAPTGHGAVVESAHETGQDIDEAVDGLDGLEIDDLRILAQERGVNVHHNAGADKIRQALRDAQAATGGDA